MNRKISKILGITSLVFASNIYAETLEEISVEAENDLKKNYKEESFYKSYSSDLVTKEDLKEKTITNVKDAIKHISNVRVKDTGSFGKNLSIRGFSSDRVTTVVDGMKIGNQGLTRMGGGEVGLVDVSDIETIEVIKSSPSVIYDPGATGGVVKIDTLKNVSKLEDMLSLEYNYLLDSGYKQNKHTIKLEGKYKKAYVKASFSKNNSKDRAVKDKNKMQKILDRINAEEERLNTPFEVTDLGYESENKNFLFNYDFTDEISAYINTYNYDAKDITNTYGSADPIVFHYDDFIRKGLTAGIQTNNLLKSQTIDLTYSSQEIEKKGKRNIFQYDSTLESKQFNLISTYVLSNNLLTFGAEIINDDSTTYVNAEQKYKALFLNDEIHLDKFIINSGIRYNNYDVSKKMIAGQNTDIQDDLVGVSGSSKTQKKDSAFNYALGVTYLFDDENNVAFNYSKTYRYPSLHERFVFDGGFVGGDFNLEAEEANNFELSWKYRNDTLSSSFAIFYSDFSTYNSLYTHKIKKSEQALQDCLSTPSCNPLDGGTQESKIFDSVYKFATFDDVKQKGFEYKIEKEFEKQNVLASFNAGYTDITDSILNIDGVSLNVPHINNPLEFGFSIRKGFESKYKPWIKLEGRHVTNYKKVEQKDGFKPFSVFDLYFGWKIKNMTFNAGVRNILDKVYHEPYSPLDGIERSFLFNVTIPFRKIL